MRYSNRSRYGKIRSLAELREERMKLSWDIRLAEEGMKAGYEGLKQKFSISNLFSSLMGGIGLGGGKLGIASSVAGGVLSMVSSLLCRRKRKRASGCGD